jgi:hypothetical protein
MAALWASLKLLSNWKGEKEEVQGRMKGDQKREGGMRMETGDREKKV